MNVFARFDDITSMNLQDFKETKSNWRMRLKQMWKQYILHRGGLNKEFALYLPILNKSKAVSCQ